MQGIFESSQKSMQKNGVNTIHPWPVESRNELVGARCEKKEVAIMAIWLEIEVLPYSCDTSRGPATSESTTAKISHFLFTTTFLGYRSLCDNPMLAMASLRTIFWIC